jgi:hypothetical protein
MGRDGDAVQPAIVRAHRLAFSLSVMPVRQRPQGGLTASPKRRFPVRGITECLPQMPDERLDLHRGGSVPRVRDKELSAFRFEANVERPEKWLENAVASGAAAIRSRPARLGLP